MFISVTAQKILETATKNFTLNAPKVCPHCETSYNPHALSAFYIKIPFTQNVYTHRVFVTYFCSACEKCFQATYLTDTKSNTILESIAPTAFHKIEFDEYIQNISPKFCTIYNQALKAEADGLNEISGIGMRRALEFLVKDFLIYKNPKDAPDIQKKSLSKAIDSIENKQIKLLSKKAAWLGNDQAHYVAKHTDRDTEDLKKLIEATKYFISMSCILDDAETIQKT